MGVTETVLIYLTIGVVVAVASPKGQGPINQAPSMGTRILWMGLWPFFAPSLFQGPQGETSIPIEADADAIGSLLLALHSLEGQLPRGVLEENEARIQAFNEGLMALRRQRGELAQLLSLPELSPSEADTALAALKSRGLGDDDPRVRSVRGRIANIERLQALDARFEISLEVGTLAMDSLRAQIRLLRFADAPEIELERLISEVSISVGSLPCSLEA